MDSEIEGIGIYIHVPFCKSKCRYCDFNSFSGRDQLIPAYFNAAAKEVAQYGGKLSGLTVDTVFIGGGTPSFVDPVYIYELMELCSKTFEICGDAEITIEANPGTLSVEKLRLYREAGINRLSMGLQAYQKNLLRLMGRIHTAEDFMSNFEDARKAGFKNINADLIFGLPGQTLRDWEKTIAGILQWEPEHLSCYSLKIEDGTIFGQMLERGELSPLDDEQDREMYYLAVNRLREAGIRHYEISNFARPGYECRHNIKYWKACRYIGVGPGAHSYFDGKRYGNICDIENYIKCVSNGQNTAENIEPVYKKDEISEFIILGLRLTEGIDTEEFRHRFGRGIFDIYGIQIKELTDRGLLECRGSRLALSSKGLDLANSVFVEFLM